jgi:hypothetical protein
MVQVEGKKACRADFQQPVSDGTELQFGYVEYQDGARDIVLAETVAWTAIESSGSDSA